MNRRNQAIPQSEIPLPPPQGQRLGVTCQSNALNSVPESHKALSLQGNSARGSRRPLKDATVQHLGPYCFDSAFLVHGGSGDVGVARHYVRFGKQGNGVKVVASVVT